MRFFHYKNEKNNIFCFSILKISWFMSFAVQIGLTQLFKNYVDPKLKMSIYGSILNSCVYISLYPWVNSIYLHWWVFIHIFWQKKKFMFTFYVQNQICKAQSFTFSKKKKSNLISFTLGHDVAELREEKKLEYTICAYCRLVYRLKLVS